MARLDPSRKIALVEARAPRRRDASRPSATELVPLALLGLALAGGSLWWSRREPASAQTAVQALAPRVHTHGTRALAERPRAAEARTVELEASAGEAPLAAQELPPLAEDRALGQPQVPSAAAPYVRAPDPPPPQLLDPDEVVPDDPHDFDLPARAAQRP